MKWVKLTCENCGQQHTRRMWDCQEAPKYCSSKCRAEAKVKYKPANTLNEMYLKNPDNGPFFTNDFYQILTFKSNGETPNVDAPTEPPKKIIPRSLQRVLQARADRIAANRERIVEIIGNLPGVCCADLCVYLKLKKSMVGEYLRDLVNEGVLTCERVANIDSGGSRKVYKLMEA
jgi:hypothetical protein